MVCSPARAARASSRGASDVTSTTPAGEGVWLCVCVSVCMCVCVCVRERESVYVCVVTPLQFDFRCVIGPILTLPNAESSGRKKERNREREREESRTEREE